MKKEMESSQNKISPEKSIRVSQQMIGLRNQGRTLTQANSPHKLPFITSSINSSLNSLSPTINLVDQLQISKESLQASQPVYTFQSDLEPMDLHKKLYVRLFKQSERRRLVQRELDALQFQRLSASQQGFGSLDSPKQAKKKTKRQEQEQRLIKELVYREEEDGKIAFAPKNTTSSLRFQHGAMAEIARIEKEYKQLSQIEKNRIFLKFVEMNEQPQRFSHYNHYKEENQRKIQLNIHPRDLANMNRYSRRAFQGRNESCSTYIFNEPSNINLQEKGPKIQLISGLDNSTLTATQIEYSINLLKEEKAEALQLGDEQLANVLSNRIAKLIQKKQNVRKREMRASLANEELRQRLLSGVSSQFNQAEMPQHQISIETMDMFADSKTNQRSSQLNGMDQFLNVSQDGLPRLLQSQQPKHKKQSSVHFMDASGPKINQNQTENQKLSYVFPQTETDFRNSNIHGASFDLGASGFLMGQSTSTIISARNLKTLNSINDPLLKIRRSVERFSKDMIEVTQKERDQSSIIEQEALQKHYAFKKHTRQAVLLQTDVKKKKEIVDNPLIEEPSLEDVDEADVSQDMKTDKTSFSFKNMSSADHGQIKMSLDDRAIMGGRRLDEAMLRLSEIAAFKVADRLGAKEFNQKVQALNMNRKLHKIQKYSNI